MPQDAAHRFIRISIRIMKLRSQIIKPLLSALDAKILIVTAHLFDALIKDHKIVDQIQEPLFIEQAEQFLKQLQASFSASRI